MSDRTSDSKFDARGPYSDCRGVVYVEFLIAFVPVFIFFLGIVQVSFVNAARLIVQHAANRAVRTAVVVLEDVPDKGEYAWYKGAPRGDLVAGRDMQSTKSMLSDLVPGVAHVETHRSFVRLEVHHQPGARMTPIRLAAYVPLSILAPLTVDHRDHSATLERSLSSRSLASAIEYNAAASAVTVHESPSELAPAAHVPRDAEAVTVRVSYLFSCSVPLARRLVCSGIETALGDDAIALPTDDRKRYLRNAEEQRTLEKYIDAGSTFILLEASASLPNQGAEYYSKEKS